MPSNNRFYPRPDTLRQKIVERHDNIMLDLYDDIVVTYKNLRGYDHSDLSAEFNSAMVNFIRYMLTIDSNDICRLLSEDVTILYKVFIKFNQFIYKYNRFRITSVDKARDILNNDNRASDECKHVLRMYIGIHELDMAYETMAANSSARAIT